MSLRYTGPNGDYPVYCCRFDRDQEAARCARKCALPVDALVERLLLDALVPDQIAIAIATMGQLEEESQQLERAMDSFAERRARYEAERRDANMMPSSLKTSRLVARGSLERTLGRRSCVSIDAIEEEHARWRSQERHRQLCGRPRRVTGLG